MKLLIIGFLLLSSLFLFAQETIELDGKKISKKELVPNKEYQVDLEKYKGLGQASKKALKENKKIRYQKITVAKNRKAYAQSTTYESLENPFELPTSSLEFFDEKGNKKWEKQFKGKGSRLNYISEDGKYCIINMGHYTNESFDTKYSLCILTENGNEVFKDESPLKMQVSSSRDMVLYQRDSLYTGDPNDSKTFFCYDLKNKNHWSQTFPSIVHFTSVSLNGDYISVMYDSTYEYYNRSGHLLFSVPTEYYDGYTIPWFSNDGKYTISNRSSTEETTSFTIYNIEDMSSINVLFADVEPVLTAHKLYNGAAFVNNAEYLVALTSIIAPYTAMVVLHNIQGSYIGHKVYHNITSSFYSPDITLLGDGSFEVYMDGYDLGNLLLPNVNTLQYLKK